MPTKYDKLKTLLRELLQLDQPDLDFGLYRIMHAKAAEVTQFLEHDLLPQVREALTSHESAEVVEARRALADRIELRRRLGDDPEADDEVKRLKQKIAEAGLPPEQLEAEIYDHLFGFFRRYYSEGDFLSKRVYKPGVYAIPYEGEEVKLHWANADQYYIKTSEYLRDYAFRLRPDDGPGDGADPMRVHFLLVDAAEGEHGNVKPANGKDRVFLLTPAEFIAEELMAGQPGPPARELAIRFEYRPATLADWPPDVREGKTKPPTQKELTELAERRVLSAAEASLPRWHAELARPHVKADGERADYSRLRAHLNRYVARNTFDYFIHKDLGTFLRRELDFFIKNEVLHLDDVEHETAPRVEQYLSKIKIIRRIAHKIIDFLAQLEDFQKKLWLKKKFVVETQYCITLDRIPEEFYEEIAANDAQREEWVRLFAIDECESQLDAPGYTQPLKIDFLNANRSLVLDTRHFNEGFRSSLLDSLDCELDPAACGLLVQADSYHALHLVGRRYAGAVKCVYIDPPYNTGNDGFIYRDSYQHSSWLTMVEQRLELAQTLMSDASTIWVSIDDNELPRLTLAFEELFGPQNWVANVIWQKVFSPKNTAQFFSHDHEYMSVWAKEKQVWRPTLLPRSAEADARYTNLDNDPRGPWSSSDLSARNYYSEGQYDVRSPSGKTFRPTLGRYWVVNNAKFLQLEEDHRIWWGETGDNVPRLKRFLSEVKEGIVPQTLWFYEDVGHTQDAKRELLSIVSFDETADVLNTVKPTGLIRRVIQIGTAAEGGDVVLDFFAGSGTTGHAVIKHNAQDGGNRRFILVEAGAYFDEMTKQRVMRALHAPEWKDGKPANGKRGSGIAKYIRLESYDDALNNLVEPRRTAEQQRLLDSPDAQGADRLKEQYMLRYLLDVETRGSQSLLNVRAFIDPTAYKLKVKRPGSDESREVNVDLLETFNWLIGLTVRHIAAPREFHAEFERDGQGRLVLKGRLREARTESVAGPPHPGPLPKGEGEREGEREQDSRFWFRTVTGTMPDGRKTLVVWRKRPGGETAEGVERDNLVLDEWFTRQGYSSKDNEFQLIYVNGGNNLENLKTPDDSWKVRVIEEDFHRLMFAGEEG